MKRRRILLPILAFTPACALWITSYFSRSVIRRESFVQVWKDGTRRTVTAADAYPLAAGAGIAYHYGPADWWLETALRSVSSSTGRFAIYRRVVRYSITQSGGLDGFWADHPDYCPPGRIDLDLGPLPNGDPVDTPVRKFEAKHRVLPSDGPAWPVTEYPSGRQIGSVGPVRFGDEYVFDVSYAVPFTALFLPPAIPLLILPAIRQRRAEFRRRNDHCPICNYDLRASQDRCPECNHLIPAHPNPPRNP